jgi:chorismate-pyruvate lyase
LYAYALSLIVIDRLPLDMQTRLEKDHEGLGRVLLSSRLESYRDVLWYGKEPAERLPKAVRQMVDREFVTRTYRIISNGKPVMLISEKFPLGGETDVAHE